MADHMIPSDLNRHIDNRRIETDRPTERSTEDRATPENAEYLRREFKNLTPEEKEALRALPPLEDLTIPWTDGLRQLDPGDSVIHRIPR